MGFMAFASCLFGHRNLRVRESEKETFSILANGGALWGIKDAMAVDIGIGVAVQQPFHHVLLAGKSCPLEKESSSPTCLC